MHFAPNIMEYIPPDLAAPMVAIAYPVAFSTRRGIQYMRKRRTKQEVEKEKKENFFIKEEIDRGDDVIIHTDSEYVLKCCGDFGRKSKQNHWKKNNEYILNHILVEQIYELYHQ